MFYITGGIHKRNKKKIKQIQLLGMRFVALLDEGTMTTSNIKEIKIKTENSTYTIKPIGD